MSLDKEIQRADEARRIMETPMVKEALDLIEKDILTGLMRSGIGDRDVHHELVLMLQTHKRFVDHFKNALETGKLARIQKESLMDKAKKLVRPRNTRP